MPSFHDVTTSAAPPEEVWKLLYDPSRFPDWWAGIGSIEVGDGGEYTMYPDGYPDFPMAQVLETERAERRVTVSCLVSDLRFEWRLEPDRDDGRRPGRDDEMTGRGETPACSAGPGGRSREESDFSYVVHSRE